MTTFWIHFLRRWAKGLNWHQIQTWWNKIAKLKLRYEDDNWSILNPCLVQLKFFSTFYKIGYLENIYLEKIELRKCVVLKQDTKHTFV